MRFDTPTIGMFHYLKKFYKPRGQTPKRLGDTWKNPSNTISNGQIAVRTTRKMFRFV